MQQFVQLALALTLLIGGGGWLYAQIFILHEMMMPLPVAAATIATLGGAAWLYGDFIFPRTRRGEQRQAGSMPRKDHRAAQ